MLFVLGTWPRMKLTGRACIHVLEVCIDTKGLEVLRTLSGNRRPWCQVDIALAEDRLCSGYFVPCLGAVLNL
jgi:hypothetical protein